jgi:hypothetical protein
MLYRGIFFQVLTIVIICYFSYDLIMRLPTSNNRKKGLDCGYIILTIIGGVTYARTFYSIPFWVKIDEELNTLDIKYFLRKPILVGPENMLSYNNTAINVSRRSGTTTYSGFYLHLGDGRRVLLSDRNFVVEDIVYIEEMLAYWGVKKGEDE